MHVCNESCHSSMHTPIRMDFAMVLRVVAVPVGHHSNSSVPIVRYIAQDARSAATCEQSSTRTTLEASDNTNVDERAQAEGDEVSS